MTFRFRIDPNARFSDGTPVTSEDVVATWKLLTDKSLQDPAQTLIYSNFEPPVAESKYIVSVKAKTQNWQNLLYFGNSMLILPAHLLKSVNGAAYIRDYNYKMMPGTGPYIVTEQDVNKGNSVRDPQAERLLVRKGSPQRRPQQFRHDQPAGGARREPRVRTLKRGDLDLFVLTRAQQWVEELNYPGITRGLNQKRKIFNNNPKGIQGVAMNTRREPYNDVRVRKALRHLFNRELMIQKLTVQRVPPDGLHVFRQRVREPGERENQIRPADSSAAARRSGMEGSGLGGTPQPQRTTSYFGDRLWNAGVRTVLHGVSGGSAQGRHHAESPARDMGDLSQAARRSGLPDGADQLHRRGVSQARRPTCIRRWPTRRTPTTSPASRTSAPTKSSRRTTTSSTSTKRVKLLRELDGIFTNEHHYILEWGAPFKRLVYWNKFGHPKGVVTRIGDYRDVPTAVVDRSGEIAEARSGDARPSIKLGEGPSEDTYWPITRSARQRTASGIV